MKILLVLVVVLLLPEGAMAARWHGGRIRIYDYTAENREATEQTVAAFNAVMPTTMPPLAYLPMEPASCDAITLPKRGIVVCETYGDLNGSAPSIKPFALSVVRLQADLPGATPEHRRHWACHELMHAVTGIPDNYEAAIDTSCVWGYTVEPGPTDIAYAESVYSHDSGPRHGAGGQHHRAKRGRA